VQTDLPAPGGFGTHFFTQAWRDRRKLARDAVGTAVADGDLRRSPYREAMFDTLAHYLQTHAATILDRWRVAVRHDPAQPANRYRLTGRELDDHLPSLVEKLAACLRGQDPGDVEKEGLEHGSQRRRHGYAIAELLQEMTLFRRVLMESIEHDFQSAPPRLSGPELALARLHLLDLIDRSVHASVAQYTREAEVERDAARVQVENATARLRTINAQLEEAHLQKNRFFSVLSHELRSPLAPILSAVEVLKRLGTPGTERPCGIIERQAKHLARLVDDLLDLNRIVHGKLELRCELIAVQQAVSFAVESSQSAFDDKGVRLAVAVAADPIAVCADPTRLSQVVLNLLLNALKFTPAGGTVTVSLAAERHAAVLRVRDTGAGITPDILPRIFEPFEQGDTSPARATGGLGLGLAIARGLVEAQGGTIEAFSAGAGRGAELVVRLPLA
jgi:signal transduction histidine kinase